MQKSKKNLDKLRKEIDIVDNQFLKFLSKRMKIVNLIGVYKKEQGLPALDNKRWREVRNSRVKKGKQLGLSESFMTKILECIHEEALKIEEKL